MKPACTGLEASARYVVRSGAETVDEILARLREARVKDFATGATQVGPHCDDVVFELDGRDAGTYASQGQLRGSTFQSKIIVPVVEHSRDALHRWAFER